MRQNPRDLLLAQGYLREELLEKLRGYLQFTLTQSGELKRDFKQDDFLREYFDLDLREEIKVEYKAPKLNSYFALDPHSLTVFSENGDTYKIDLAKDAYSLALKDFLQNLKDIDKPLAPSNALPKSGKGKRAAAILAAALIVGGGTLAGTAIYNRLFNEWITEKYASLGIEQEEEASGLMQKTMKEYYNKYKNLDTSDTAQVERYLNQVNKDIRTQSEKQGADIDNLGVVYGVMLKGKNLEIRLSSERSMSHSYFTYELNENQLAELYAYLNSDDADVQIMLPLFIKNIINSQTPQKIDNLGYKLDGRFYVEISALSEHINSKGYNTEFKNFYFKAIFGLTQEATIGYVDENIISEFTIKCLREGSTTNGFGLSTVVGNIELLEQAAKQFAENAVKIINLFPYFSNGDFYKD